MANMINSALDTEKYALSLIKALAKSENKEFYIEYKIKSGKNYRILDGYAPNGLSNLKGPVAVEIKTLGQFSIPYEPISTIENFVEDLSKFEFNIKTFILVLNFNLYHESKDFPSNVVIWDKRKLELLAKRFLEIPFQFNVRIEGVSEEHIIKNVLKIFEKRDYNEDVEDHIRNLIIAIKNKDLSLFLGSGVSKGEELPKWETLIEDLISLINKKAPFRLNKIFKQVSNIILCEMIKRSLSDFYNPLRSILYKNYNRTIKNNSILDHISKLCSLKPEIGIFSIITYNFDDILEYYLRAKKVSYKTIFYNFEKPSNNQIPIYHVHGFLPFNKKLTQDMKDSIIITEPEYHDLYEKHYSWQNFIQLSTLSEKTVLFVGLSMKDPNLRRLLHIANKHYAKGSKHYAIIFDHWDDFSDKNLSNELRKLEEVVFKNIGLNIIWVQNEDELIKIFNALENV